VNIQDWQLRNDKAREDDQKALHNRLNDLETNQSHLVEMLSMYSWRHDLQMIHTMLDAQHHSLTAMMVSLQRNLKQLSAGDREHHFLSHSVRYLSTTTGGQISLESWMITSFDVEFGAEIGSGG
jgi:hypothetical protein